MHDHLTAVRWRPNPIPSAGALDSWILIVVMMMNPSVGYDACEKIKERKRFTLVDTMELSISVKVVAASVLE